MSEELNGSSRQSLAAKLAPFLALLIGILITLFAAKLPAYQVSTLWLLFVLLVLAEIRSRGFVQHLVASLREAFERRAQQRAWRFLQQQLRELLVDASRSLDSNYDLSVGKMNKSDDRTWPYFIDSLQAYRRTLIEKLSKRIVLDDAPAVLDECLTWWFFLRDTAKLKQEVLLRSRPESLKRVDELFANVEQLYADAERCGLLTIRTGVQLGRYCLPTVE